MVTDDDGNTAVEKRIAAMLDRLTDGPYISPRPSSVPSFAQHVHTQDELERQRERVRHERALRRHADLEVAADVRKRLNTRPDRVTLHPMS
jgi:hypothetical protein